MPVLARIRTSRIGHPKARLDGLDIDLTLSNRPVDTVIYGANGCGKTSLIQLFFSLLLPYRRNFLGKTGDGDRTFDLYFLPREVSFFVTEWEFPASVVTLPGLDVGTRRRVFGRCLQQTKPGGASTAAEYDGFFFSFWADDSINSSLLPLTDNIRSGRAPRYLKSAREFRSWFKEVVGERYDLEPYIVDDSEPGKWQAHLTGCGIDLELVKLMLLLNHGEGATGGFLSQFKTEELVVKFITEMLSDEGSCDRLRAMVVSHLESLRQEPFVRRRKELLDMLEKTVAELAPHGKRLLEAQVQFKEGETALALAAAGTGHLVTAMTEQRLALEQEAGLARENGAVAEKAAELLEAEQRWCELRATDLAVTEADAAHHSAEVAQKAAICDLHLGAAALGRQRIVGLQAERRAAETSLAEREQVLGLDDLRTAVNDRGASLKEILLASAVSAEEQAAVGESEKDSKQAELNKTRDEGTACAGSICTLQQEQKDLQRIETLRSNNRAELEKQGMLGPDDTATAVLERTAMAVQQVDTDGDSLQRRIAELTGETANLSARADEQERLAELHWQVVAKKTALLKRYDESAKGLRVNEALLTMFETDSVDPYEPMLFETVNNKINQNAEVRRRLEDEAQAITTQIEDLDANDGLLPPSADVAAVIGELAARSTESVPWWRVFADQKLDSDDIRQRIAANPGRYAGVALLRRDDLKIAAEIAAGFEGVKSPVVISFYGDSDDSGSNGITVVPNPALYASRSAAASWRSQQEAELVARTNSIKMLGKAIHAQREALRLLNEFLLEFAFDKVAKFKRDLAEAEQQHAQAVAQQAKFKQEEQAARADLVSKTVSLRSLERNRLAVRERLRQLSSFIDVYEKGRPERLLRLGAIETELTKENGEAERLRQEIIKLNGEIETISQKIIELQTIGRGSRRRAGEVEYVQGNASCVPADQQINAAVATAAYDAARIDYQAGSNDATLVHWQHKHQELVKKIAVEQTSFQQDFHGVGEDSLVQFEAAYPEGFNQAALSDLENNAKNAAVTTGITDGELKRCNDLLEELRSRYRGRRTAPPAEVPLTSAASRELSMCKSAEREAHAGEAKKFSNEYHEKSLAAVAIGGDISKLSGLIEGIVPSQNQVNAYENVPEAESAIRQARDVRDLAVRERSLAEKEVAAKLKPIRHVVDAEENLAADPETIRTFRQNMDELYLQADEVLAGLRDAAAPLGQELESYERTKLDIVNELAAETRLLIKKLKHLNRLSEVPNLGGTWLMWAGMPFVRFTVRPEIEREEEMRNRLSHFLVTVAKLDKGVPPSIELVFGALREVLGNGYRVETLIPNERPTTEYLGVSAPGGMKEWSGGERLTGVVLFYMSLAKLVTTHKSMHQQDAHGLLVLDNPYGTSNHPAFVALQFAVARQMGIQLLCTIIADDKNILGSFPKVISLRKGAYDPVTEAIHVIAGASSAELTELGLHGREN